MAHEAEFEFDPGDDPSKATEDALRLALFRASSFVLQKANETVPVTEHHLQRSGKASVSDDGHRAAVSYDTPYAVRQHEELAYRHDEGQRAKWLESTMHEQADEVRDIIGETLRGEL